MSDEVKFVLFTVIPIIQDVLIIILFARGTILHRKRKASKSDRIVSLSPILLWVGAIGGSLLSVPGTLSRGTEQWPDGVWYIFEAFILACIAMMLAYCNETVTYEESKFEASNLLGIKHTYDYGEITGIASKGGDTILYCGRRRIRLDTMSSGGDKFVAYADKAYFRQQKKYIPVRKSKKDPMNGNLDTPWLYLFFSAFAFVTSICMIVFPGLVLRPADDSIPDNAVEVQTTFSSFDRTKKHSGTIQLNAPGYEKPFVISWLSGYEVSVPAPEMLCGGELFHVVADETRDQYYIYAISSDDKGQLLSAYDYNTAYRNTQLVPCICLMIMGVVIAVVSVFMVLVGRHPERYPGWFRGLFYKGSAWTSPTGNYLNAYTKRRNKKRHHTKNKKK